MQSSSKLPCHKEKKKKLLNNAIPLRQCIKIMDSYCLFFFAGGQRKEGK